MTAAIELRGLAKHYGEVRALDSVDLVVEEGAVFGFLGPNGAGKTTALRLLNGLARPSAGSARIFGHAAGSPEARDVVGFLPDVPGFYEWMTAAEYLRFAGGLFGLQGEGLEERVSVLLQMAGLAGITTRLGGFSRGMKQRLGVAQALVNAPRLLMLDEPTSALDPLGRRDVLDMIASLKGRTTVFFSTHILSDVERVCDTVAVLDHGAIVAHGPIEELKARYAAHRIVVEVTDGAEGLAESVGAQAWATSVQRDGQTLRVSVSDTREAGRALPALLTAAGLTLVRVEPGEIDLEEVFVDLVGQSTGGQR
ncbi:MAG: ABC transporter ATP-binding protein [Coriobacteriia bacterium]|nr:ABC transporter ATP-binding protein [Coriobacteriia bacterium]